MGNSRLEEALAGARAHGGPMFRLPTRCLRQGLAIMTRSHKGGAPGEAVMTAGQGSPALASLPTLRLGGLLLLIGP